jgi:putative tryptophan/tyrosine transport system substrate-binding protein
MKRRAFIAALGGAAAWPVVARAQQAGTISRIGFLSPNTLKSSQALVNFQAFRRRLRELGLGEGRDFTID